ncbi:MAG: phosphoglycerate kinase [Coriobacteriales bacterium]|jgi:phosphoglycerate kinase|nr:phosphoglycerate kinase [Coriobacteriales bacterium]
MTESEGTLRLVNEADVTGKRVLLRVDFNVPVADGVVIDDTRIRAVLPTIRYLIDNRARIIVISHQGRPKGDGYERKYTLAPIARALGELLKRDVQLTHDILGKQTAADVEALEEGEVLMLENLRFDAGEKSCDMQFAKRLSELADVFVNDAFAAAHRTHASITGVTQFLPSYAGFLMNKELGTFDRMLAAPAHPFVAILGGSKVSDKIKVINKLIDTVDVLIIGGAMCFTFLAAQGYSVGASLKEDDWIGPAADLLKKAAEKGVQFLLPTDLVIASKASADAKTSICDIAAGIPDDRMGLDIGPATIKLYLGAIAKGRTVFWNGPMGVFELEPFANGTRQVATAVAMNSGATTIIGGGDSIAAINKFGYDDLVTFISTGGGAALELLEGSELPGVMALRDASTSVPFRC